MLPIQHSRAEYVFSLVPKFEESDANNEESNSVASEDFETAITKAGFGKFNYFMLLIAIPASCTAAFVTGTMSYVIPVAVHDLGLTPMSKAMLQSAPYAGMIFSAYFWGALSDSFGRQRLLAAGFLLDFAMNTASALIPYVPSIVVFKFLSGIMVCGPYSIFMAYISEVFLDKRRDLAVLSSGVFSSSLQILHVCLALLVTKMETPDWFPLKSWQIFILCSGIPALIAGSAFVFCVESPKFLTEKGKTKQALDVCKTIYTINTGKAAETYPVKKIHAINEVEGSKKKEGLNKLFAATAVFKPPYIYRLMMVWGIQMSIASTMNLMRLWLPEMLTVMSNADLRTANLTNTLCPLLAAGREAQASGLKVISRDHVYYTMMTVNAGILLSQILFTVIVKRVGKKPIIIADAIVSLCCAIALPNISSEYVFIPAAIIIAFLNTGFFAQVGLIVEVFPTNVRATSVSMTMMFGRIAVLAGNFIFANLMYTSCEYIFYFLAGSCLSIVIIASFLDTTPFNDRSKE